MSEIVSHYSVQMLTPTQHRPGLRWKVLAERDDKATSVELMEDIVESMADAGVARDDAWHWATTHLRAVEVIQTTEYGKSFHVGS